MADFKQFKQKGVGDDLQLGRRGPRVIVQSGNVLFRDSANSAYINVEVADPTTDDQAATKRYVDAVASGLDLKASCRAATTSPLPNSPTYNNGTGGVGATLTASTLDDLPSLDGVSITTGDRILVKDQANALENGIYTLTEPGADGVTAWELTRATDADDNSGSPEEVTPGLFTFVEEGSVNADTGWVVISDGSITIGTSDIDFTQFSGTGTEDPLYRQDTVAFNDSSPVNLSLALPQTAIIQRVKVNVDTAWDDSATTLAVGNGVVTYMDGNGNDLLESTLFIEELLGTAQVGANNQLQAVLTGGTPTQGQATVHVEYVLG